MSSNERDRNRRDDNDDGFIEKLVAVNRVSKTVKGLTETTSPARIAAKRGKKLEEILHG